MVLLGIIITEIVRPKPINWKQSYIAKDKIPFGCYVLYNELPRIFPKEPIRTINESPYETLAYRDYQEKSNYIFVNTKIAFDQEETVELLDYVSDGNTVFIAANDFGQTLTDTLHIETKTRYGLSLIHI